MLNSPLLFILLFFLNLNASRDHLPLLGLPRRDGVHARRSGQLSSSAKKPQVIATFDVFYVLSKTFNFFIEDQSQIADR